MLSFVRRAGLKKKGGKKENKNFYSHLQLIPLHYVKQELDSVFHNDGVFHESKKDYSSILPQRDTKLPKYTWNILRITFLRLASEKYSLLRSFFCLGVFEFSFC